MDTFKNDKILEYWDNRADRKLLAGSNDLLVKELEKKAISSHIKDGMVVAEFGCGNGITAVEFLRQYDVKMHCYDFSPKMIQEALKNAQDAGVADRAFFSVLDVRNETIPEQKFDLIYSQRMIINLSDWTVQSRVINYLLSCLKPGGNYLMCEQSQNGLENINRFRAYLGLEKIEAPWHNSYIDDEEILSFKPEQGKLSSIDSFSSTYYFLSRIINAWMASREGQQPSYDAPINQLAFLLPSFGDFSQGKLWVLQRE